MIRMINWLVRLLFVVMLFTNDSARTLSIPIGSFHIVERDIVLYALLLVYLLYLTSTRVKTPQGMFLPEVCILLSMYYVTIPWGMLNGNGIQHMGYNIRQVNYLLAYFPLVLFINNSTEKQSPQQILRFILTLIIIGAMVSLVLFGFYCGKAVNLRNMFYWVDYPLQGQRFPRILLATSLYFPAALLVIMAYVKGNITVIVRNKKYLAVVGIISVAFLLTFSRSLWVSFFVMFMVTILIVRGSFVESVLSVSKYIVVALIIGGVLYLVNVDLFFDLVNRISSIVNTKMMSVAERFQESGVFMSKIQERPFFGYGQGASVHFYLPSFDAYITTPFSHNSYLIYLLNYGVVGTGIIAACFLSLTMKIVCCARNSPQRNLIIGLSMGMAGVLIASLVTSTVTYASGYFYLAVYLALVSALIQQRKDRV